MFKSLLGATACILLAARLLAQSPTPKPAELSEDQKKFIALCKELDKAYEDFHAGSEKHQDHDDYIKYITEKDPIIEFGPKLEALEREHHGTHLGLMIVRRLMRGNGSLLDTPVDAYQ